MLSNWQESRFQFQYGAIKRWPTPTTAPKPLRFQFQYGAIKSMWVVLLLPRVVFQFQYGAIKRCAGG